MPEQQNDADIFDRSFKKIIGGLSSRALIRFINGLFGSNHPLDSEVRRLNTEQINESLKKRLCDEIVSVEGQKYVIEEQTTVDSNMAIRIFEYGYAEALKDKETLDGVILLPFPRMIVIYLEAGRAAPDVLTVRMKFPDGTGHDFKVKTLKLLDRSVEELAEHGLAALLPFYIIRLRKSAGKAGSDAEFKELALKLKDAIEQNAAEGQLNDEDILTLLERLSRLAEYVGGKYKTVTEVKKMLDTSLMGYGQELALKYKLKYKLEGKLEDARNALNEGLSVEQTARITGIPIDELKKHLVSD
jgi:hypothetical protein